MPAERLKEQDIFPKYLEQKKVNTSKVYCKVFLAGNHKTNHSKENLRNQFKNKIKNKK